MKPTGFHCGSIRQWRKNGVEKNNGFTGQKTTTTQAKMKRKIDKLGWVCRFFFLVYLLKSSNWAIAFSLKQGSIRKNHEGWMSQKTFHQTFDSRVPLKKLWFQISEPLFRPRYWQKNFCDTQWRTICTQRYSILDLQNTFHSPHRPKWLTPLCWQKSKCL